MQQNEFIEASPLGDKSAYITEYDPSLLFPIPRNTPWQPEFTTRPFYGIDVWNAFEISWLNDKGLPKMALAEFRIPGDSPNIIESKSFKLYLNSFNQTKVFNATQVQQRMIKDLSAAAGAPVQVTLFSLRDMAMPVLPVPGVSIDQQDIEITTYRPDASLLSADSSIYRTETLHSDLLKSNCPVTGQPDWATIVVEYEGPRIDRAGLLAYIVSYREHGDFHEQCVEQIFLDIKAQCKPGQLTVYARYVRRGGLDINPYRSTRPLTPSNHRTQRQ
jgi:7-cyano-7-deazaguanine reductase